MHGPVDGRLRYPACSVSTQRCAEPPVSDRCPLALVEDALENVNQLLCFGFYLVLFTKSIVMFITIANCRRESECYV